MHALPLDARILKKNILNTLTQVIFKASSWYIIKHYKSTSAITENTRGVAVELDIKQEITMETHRIQLIVVIVTIIPYD